MIGLTELRCYLEKLPAGPIREVATVESLLMACWDTLRKAPESRMAAHKLCDRMEQVAWEPPNLHFSIERHGGTVLGSSRAVLQRWTIDVHTGSAEYDEFGYRQLSPRQVPLYTQPLAEEIAEHVIQGKNHPALKWLINRSRVLVLVAEIIPAGGPKQTVADRRRRFKKALVRQLAAAGWFQAPGKRIHTYEKHRSDDYRAMMEDQP